MCVKKRGCCLRHSPGVAEQPHNLHLVAASRGCSIRKDMPVPHRPPHPNSGRGATLPSTVATRGWCRAAIPGGCKARYEASWRRVPLGHSWGRDLLPGSHLPACPCIIFIGARIGKSSSGFLLLLRRAKRVSQKVTTEECDS